MKANNYYAILVFSAVLLSLLTYPANISANNSDASYQVQGDRKFSWQTPLPAGTEFTVGDPGNYYLNCDPDPCDLHCHCPPADYYAIDINSGIAGNDDCGIYVLAAADGWVSDVSFNTDAYGYSVVLSHPDQFQSRYAHFIETPLVRKDTWVAQGTPIGKVGSTGASFRCHLHFNVYYKDTTGFHSSKPEPLGSQNTLTDGMELTSQNYGPGYTQFNDNKILPDFHEEIYNVYEQLRSMFFLEKPPLISYGGIGIIGSATKPVTLWENQDGIYFQEFSANPNSSFEWAREHTSAIFEITTPNSPSQAYFIAGPIWKQYQEDKGSLGKWGKPVSHSYNQSLMGSNGVRSDFTNGSIVWHAGQYEFIEKPDIDKPEWEANFFLEPNIFIGDSIPRFDKKIDFSWSNSSYPGPFSPNKARSSGFSVKWEIKHKRMIGVTKFIVPELQGHLQIYMNGELLLDENSPDAIKPFETDIRWTIGQQHIILNYWQDNYKPGRISLTVNGLKDIVKEFLNKTYPYFAYALEAPTYYDISVSPDLDYADYDPPPYPGEIPPIGNGNSSTILVFDASGSMDELDSSGLTKIEASRRAGTQILNIIAAENSANSVQNSVGIASYSTTSRIVSPLTNDIPSLYSPLNTILPSNKTAMADGLQTGLQMFGSPQDKKILILLSDGLANIGLNTDMNLDYQLIKQQVLDLATQAGQDGICIYTVGFGDANSLDEAFLQQIASSSGCGSYYGARDAISLANVYVGLRHSSTGSILSQQTGQISQGQQIDLGNVDVPENQELMLFTLNWPGGKLDAILKDPVGTIVDQNYPGTTFSVTSSLVSVIVNRPIPGAWNLGIMGVDVPEGTTVYNAILSARQGVALPTLAPTAPPAPVATGSSGGFSFALLMLVLVGGGLGVYIYSNSLKRGGNKHTSQVLGTAKLIGKEGGSNQTILLKDGMIIGRGSRSDIRLHDRTVSRWHARFRFAHGDWFIQDMGSSSGIYVNGQRVSAGKLISGDQIQIGSYYFTFFT
ncbi:MAG TPA: peptidoglycan DD-metalloendopeptidase family protein [Anaerolineaceae bacterium]|nr:peptidoglycan DD-metalloendopeptidase family protein [Anaerolineaceae bacterium]